jgi:VWFA-related protein
MTRRLSLLGTLLLLGFASQAYPQGQRPTPPGVPAVTPPAQRQNPPRIIVPTYTVIVPVTVKDNRGQLVGDLEKKDFRVFSDNIEQKVGQFSSEPVPLSAVVLIDNDLDQHQVSQVQKSLTAISAGFGPMDEVAVVTYDQFPETVADFSFNNDHLFTQLKRLDLESHNSAVIADPTTAGPAMNGHQPVDTARGVPQHGSKRYRNDNALDDAVFAASNMLKERGRDRRKIIFLISDGTNAKNEHTFDETLHSLLANDVAVYSISVTRSLPIGKSLIQRGASDLEKYALNSGGDTFYASKQPELERLYSDVTEQARNQYTLTFSPENIPKGQDFHEIEVRVERQGLNVETRRGFYLSAISAGH